MAINGTIKKFASNPVQRLVFSIVAGIFMLGVLYATILSNDNALSESLDSHKLNTLQHMDKLERTEFAVTKTIVSQNSNVINNLKKDMNIKFDKMERSMDKGFEGIRDLIKAMHKND